MATKIPIVSSLLQGDDSQTFAGRSTWQHFYDGEPSFDVLTLEEADRRLIESNDAKDDHMTVKTPTHTKVVASSQPCEDTIAKGLIQGSDRTYEVWAVFDGHGGWATSWKMRKEMIPWLEKYLVGKEKSNASQEDIVASIQEACTSFDKHIHDEATKALDLVHNQDANALARGWAAMAPANAGSCALICIHDTKESTLYTACVGDSRALLLHPSKDEQSPNTYTIQALSIDQNGFNTAETDRIKSEHPGEEPVEDKFPYRTLGIMVTRAFGDHVFKLPQERVKAMQAKLIGSPPKEKSLTPPYLHARPEVTVTPIQPGNILIMASDGLWDHMTNEGAGECMSAWTRRFSDRIKNPSHKLPSRTGESDSRPYEMVDDGHGGTDWKFESESIVAEDENAATSLIRNSIGGMRRELFTAVISVPLPARRSVVDDVSVHVVFF